MTRKLYVKTGGGFIAGKWHDDDDSIAMTAAEARYPLLEGIIRPASKTAQKTFEAPAAKPARAPRKSRAGK